MINFKEARISIVDAFLKEFSADSSDVKVILTCLDDLKLRESVQVDWLDPHRDSIAPRTFDVIYTETGYTFEEV